MKKKPLFVLITIFFSVQNILLLAQNINLIVKQKKISKHYNVNATDTLAITNNFGCVKINTWDKYEITIDIIATAKAKNTNRARMILDSIKITEETNKKQKIFFKTIIHHYNESSAVESLSTPASNDNLEANVSYVINAPKNIALDINNAFGDVSIGDFSGKLSIDIIHGRLYAKNISGQYNNIVVIRNGYGNDTSTIKSIQAGKIVGGGDLLITKPIDPSKVVFDGWNSITIDGKQYNPKK